MVNCVDSRKAYIFTDEHCINHECAVQTQDRLQSFGVVPVTLSDSSYLQKALLTERKGVLIIPGGKTGMLPSCLEHQIGIIKLVVNGGWNYHGTCAGANFTCKEFTMTYFRPSKREVNYAKQLPWLGMLPVEARFPIYNIKESFSASGVDNERKSAFVTPEGERFTAFWNEGSILIPKSPDVQVTASYADIEGNPAAAVIGNYGDGIVNIMSMHPEIQGYPLADPITAEDDSAKSRELFLKRSFQSVGVL